MNTKKPLPAETRSPSSPRSYGDFLLAVPISDAVNLVSISLRLGGRRLL